MGTRIDLAEDSNVVAIEEFDGDRTVRITLKPVTCVEIIIAEQGEENET